MTVNAEKLVRMADQIAANVTVSKDPGIIAERVAEHLNRFWDRRMRVQFVEYVSNNSNELRDIINRISRLIRTAPAGAKD